MLHISKPLSTRHTRTYYIKDVFSAEQALWPQEGNTQGQWYGKLAAKFGLAGPVGADQFALLSEGRDPHTGEQLIRHLHVAHTRYETENGKKLLHLEHRAGWDATFSAPKSLSLTALIGGDDRVREAHRDAVTAALEELERYTFTRVGLDRARVLTGNFVAATFEHDSARPVEGYAAPHLHTHTVIFNMTERADGKIRSLEPMGLFDSVQFANAVYQSEWTRRVRNLGYEIEPGRSGAPEIKGYSQQYLDASSPRHQQILEYLERNGLHRDGSSEIATHLTRDSKKMLSPDEALAAHRQLAAEFGNQADRVVAEAHRRERTHAQHSDPQLRQSHASEAVTFARDRSFEREAVTDERILFRDALRRGMGEITFAEIRANFENRLATGEFQIIAGHKRDTGRKFTTEEAIRAEKEVIERMEQGQNRASPILSIQRAVQLTESQQQLTKLQRAAIEQILISRDVVQGLQGRAGVGKSTALQSVQDGAQRRGYAVEGLAPTSRATQQLKEVGVSATTLQSFLLRPEGPVSVPHLYLVDEASLVSTKQMRDFLRKLGPADRAILIGDTRQHQGVEAGKPFEQLVQAGMRTVELDQIIRQKDPELKRAVEHLSRGEIATGVALLDQQGRITEIADTQRRIAAIARSYAEHPDNTLIVSPDNASRRQINQAVRVELQRIGKVQSDEQIFRVLVQRSDMTGADRTWAARYDLGGIVQYQRGSNSFENQSYAQVVAIQPKGNRLTVQKPDGERITYNPVHLRGVNVYREIERAFAVGDKLAFTASNRELGIANRDLGTVEQISSDGVFAVRMDSGKSLSFNANQMRHFDHGYAVTSHSSQGLTAERVLVNVDTNVHTDLVNQRFAYVSISRASQDAQLYTNDATELVASLSLDTSKSSAVEVTRTSDAPGSMGHANVAALATELGAGIGL